MTNSQKLDNLSKFGPAAKRYRVPDSKKASRSAIC